MKLSIIHNLYKKNPFVNESVKLNLLALKESKVEYQYILFNDNGDERIIDDINEFICDNVEYVYSNINYGKKQCSGGWVGAQKYVKGDFIHNTGQDDVFTAQYFKCSIDLLQSDDSLMLVFSNAFRVNENLQATEIMLPVQEIHQYYNDPFTVFKRWFGVGENGKNEVTRANNMILAPGVIYKKTLHEKIGFPDLDNFLGAADFEYWSRILFNGYKCKELANPLWFYRCSNLSTSNETVNSTVNWVDKVKTKYYNLYKEKYGN